jgi:ATP-dependent Clp protease ATP-binding subunit ClpA
MDDDLVLPHGGSIEAVDPTAVEQRLRDAARLVSPDPRLDDLEVRHMLRVVMECSLLLTDVYSRERLTRIMSPDRGVLFGLVGRLVEQERQGEGEVLYRIRRLPDDARVVGDKALFDLGVRGLRRVKGYDLEDLGSRAYRLAGEALELLAEDRRLREFFRQNRLLVLPLEEEVVFLHQCAQRFPLYASILQRMRDAGPPTVSEDPAVRVPILAAAEAALRAESIAASGPVPATDPMLQAVHSDDAASLSRDEALSVYERMILFSSVDTARLRSALRSVVVDQERAVDALCDEFTLFSAGTRDLRRPPAFFLVGPTGVGKNHLVECVRRLLQGVWHQDIPMLTVEGPNYTYASDINELRGATRGFIRSDEEGLLTSFHERSSKAPLAVLLVDEVEKAHAQLRTFFLSILDRGTTTDNRGRELRFFNTLIFFTSNLGYSDVQQRAAPIGYLDEDARYESSDRDVRAGLRKALSPEFMNRVRMIHFDRLTERSAERILDLEFGKIARRYAEIHGTCVVLDPTARHELIRRGFSPVFGARHLAAVLDGVCNVEVAKTLRGSGAAPGGDLQEALAWLHEIRAGTRPFVEEEVRRRVWGLVRVPGVTRALRIRFEGGRFVYVLEGELLA